MNQMTITAILWGNQGEYMVPIHNIDGNTVVNDRHTINRQQPSFNDLRGIPHNTFKSIKYRQIVNKFGVMTYLLM
ncbi:unnamed protein product [Adineta steineri]|uniref:Uncharacterized protein n=1 Tax=Adineta steineri TaxID=433720 RepID=A0A815V7D4_9BILA|nr:unnamed protein product [Adineta steineri]